MSHNNIMCAKLCAHKYECARTHSSHTHALHLHLQTRIRFHTHTHTDTGSDTHTHTQRERERERETDTHTLTHSFLHPCLISRVTTRHSENINRFPQRIPSLRSSPTPPWLPQSLLLSSLSLPPFSLFLPAASRCRQLVLTRTRPRLGSSNQVRSESHVRL